MGELYPKAIFHGNDLSPIQPNMVPDNVYFVVDDFEDEWVWPENKFDYIHMRHTVHSVKDRTALFKKIFKYAYRHQASEGTLIWINADIPLQSLSDI